MPAGPSELGFAYFAVVKYFGYTAYCRYVVERKVRALPATALPDASGIPNVWYAGAVRTVLGVVIGAAVGIGFWKIPATSSFAAVLTLLFFGLLIPVRVGEWWLLLRWVYRDYALQGHTRRGVIAGGIVVSFALDALGMLTALIVPGGAWVC